MEADSSDNFLNAKRQINHGWHNAKQNMQFAAVSRTVLPAASCRSRVNSWRQEKWRQKKPTDTFVFEPQITETACVPLTVNFVELIISIE
jgi:hypothetical protein